MLINDRLEVLYKNYYGENYPNIVRCGVVDEVKYLSKKPRICFVLKETHSSENGWSLPLSLRRNVDNGMETKFSYTWVQAGIWAYAIHNGFNEYQQLNKPDIIREGLGSIAVINLKKTGGSARAIPEQIADSSQAEVSLWQSELEIIDPELIICGKTFKNVCDNLNLPTEKLLEHNGKNYYYAQYEVNEHRSVVLQFWHPACRKPRADTLELFGKLVRELRLKQLLD